MRRDAASQGICCLMLVLVTATVVTNQAASACTAEARSDEPGYRGPFAGESEVFLFFLNSMPASVPNANGLMRRFESQAQRAAEAWTAARSNGADGEPKAFAEVTYSSSPQGDESNGLPIVFKEGVSSLPTADECAPGVPALPPAQQVVFTNPDGTTTNGIIIWTQFGCDGQAPLDTFGNGSVYRSANNIFNLLAHESGHALGLGHDDCEGR